MWRLAHCRKPATNSQCDVAKGLRFALLIVCAATAMWVKATVVGAMEHARRTYGCALIFCTTLHTISKASGAKLGSSTKGSQKYERAAGCG